MRLYTIFYLSICFLCAALAENYEDSHDWDVLLYTQRYPITVCMDWKEKNKSHSCTLPKPEEDIWTVHGIWPTRFGSIGPQFCNRSWNFDPEEIKPIESVLLNLWTNVEKDTSEYSFWAHEWNKHGTCAAIIEPLNTQIKYFKQGLDWLSSFSMSKILQSAGIVPSNNKKYSLNEIHGTIKNALNVNPVIECRKEKGISYLFELRICFDKQLKLKDCDGVIGYGYKSDGMITNCDKHLDVDYPLSLPDYKVGSSFQLPYVQLYKLVSWLQWMTL